MSLYRTLMAAVAAIVIASPVFAQDAATSAPAENAPAATDNSMMQNSSATDQAAATDAKVNVNKATAKELMKVKGMNASKARALVACRKKQKGGSFASLDDMSKCKGFTKMKADDMKAVQDQLTTE